MKVFAPPPQSQISSYGLDTEALVSEDGGL